MWTPDKKCKSKVIIRESTCTVLCVYLGCLRRAGYMDSAGFDSVCFGALEERKSALPPSAVSVRERAIVPAHVRKHTHTLKSK